MKTLAPIFWTAMSLLAADLAIGLLTQYPDDPVDGTVNSFQRYFNYGRSIESKVRWMTGIDNSKSSPLARSGWLIREQERKAQADDGRKLLVAFYGMSFSAYIATALEQVDPLVSVRISGGPGATVSRSYADYQLDLGNHEAKVIVLGILASSIEYGATVTHMTWNFEAPSSHFYPKYYVEQKELNQVNPPVNSLNEFRDALGSEMEWNRLIKFVQKHDPYYDPFSFHANILDQSIIARLIRRAWAQRKYSEEARKYHTAQGFTDYNDSITTTVKIIEQMSAAAKANGQLFIALLISNRGYSNHLFESLSGPLKKRDIRYLSSHKIVNPDDYNNFQPDGHFQVKFDAELAQNLSQLVRSELPDN